MHYAHRQVAVLVFLLFIMAAVWAIAGLSEGETIPMVALQFTLAVLTPIYWARKAWGTADTLCALERRG